MKKITIEEATEHFDEAGKERARTLLASDGVEALILFVNQQLDSSQLGRRTLMAVGEGCTYTTDKILKARHLYDLPSQRQYPVGIVLKAQG